MTTDREIFCIKLQSLQKGLDKPPFPGEIGVMIYNQVSELAWTQWLEHLTTIINENGLSTANVDTLKILSKYMYSYFKNDVADEEHFEGLRIKRKA